MEGTITESPISPTNAWSQKSTPVTSPWGNKVEVIPCSLEQVMSEQLASELASEENRQVDFTEGDAW